MRFKLILSSVKPTITDKVVDAAKEAGATGATIIQSRGTGMREAKTFFGLSLEAQTDIIMFLVEDQVLGLESQIEKFKEEVRESYF